MSPEAVAIAALVTVAIYVAVGATPVSSRLRAAARRREPYIAADDSRAGLGQATLSAQVDGRRWAVPSCLLCAAVAWLLIGGVAGLIAAAAIGVLGPQVLARMESGGVRANRLAMEAAAPMVADLLAACLASGASTAAATRATADALGGPVADVLNRCVTQFNLGASAQRVWRPLTDEPALAPIARAILRSAETGAPLTSVLLRVSDDLRLNRRAQLEQAAKTVGVKAVGPLGLCFLPAFMLLGVVPLIASLIAAGLPG